MAATRREAALELAEELLSDIELSRVSAPAIVRKTSRLARLLDDSDALVWLGYETSGYIAQAEGGLDPAAWAAAQRSNRVQRDSADNALKANPSSVGEIEARIEGGKAYLAAAASGIPYERASGHQQIASNSALLSRVVGAMHAYSSAKYHELRFGAAVESAFETVRSEVDASIGTLVPDALPKLSAAFENTSSTNPEHWAQAASSCRRLLKAAADQLRPPGPDVADRKMGDENYVNRLVDWIAGRSVSGTFKDAVCR